MVGGCMFPIANPHKGSIIHIVPAPTIAEDHQNIVHYFNQFSIYALNNIEQE